MTNRQKYLFDVAGYVVLDDILQPNHCQRLIDALQTVVDTPETDLPADVRLTPISHTLEGV